MGLDVLKFPLPYSGLYPEYAVFGGVITIILLIFLLPRLAAALSVWISLFALGLAFYFSSRHSGGLLPSPLEASSWTDIIKQYFCVSAAVSLFAWVEWKQERKVVFSAIFLCLLLTAVLSLMVLVQAADLWLMILAAEGFSFSAYGLASANPDAENAAPDILRYFGIGALATAVSVFGFSWLKGFENAAITGEGGFADSLAFFPVAGAVFFLAFIFFKLGCFPFQSWISGVFISSPTPVAGFLASAPKIAAGFVCLNLFQLVDVNLTILFVFIAFTTGILGNLSAFQANQVKEMLAFSSIGQASFLIIPSIFSRQVSGAETHLLYFSLVYGTAIQAAFSAVQYFENSLGDRLRIEDFSSSSRLHPVPAFVFCGILFSIIGIPPFAGFTAKLLVMSGLPAGSNLFPSALLYALYFIGLLNTVLAAGYFLRIPYQMFFGKAEHENPVLRPSAASYIIMVAGILIQLLLFFFPSGFLAF
jgi:NADH-quinone oxidoreductase subunit N